MSFILLIGGMYVMGLSFNIPEFGGVLFVLGVLLVSAALATPLTASAIDYRGEKSPR
ncbi:hypothetical protein ACFC3F_13980 [Microbacterium sp. NPDC055910]|uniref:hypothetical protein n=1 Tax=Microbacterium sp. NPDC055910 TaxID=3345659 RepID=UPI0035E203F9